MPITNLAIVLIGNLPSPQENEVFYRDLLSSLGRTEEALNASHPIETAIPIRKNADDAEESIKSKTLRILIEDTDVINALEAGNHNIINLKDVPIANHVKLAYNPETKTLKQINQAASMYCLYSFDLYLTDSPSALVNQQGYRFASVVNTIRTKRLGYILADTVDADGVTQEQFDNVVTTIRNSHDFPLYLTFNTIWMKGNKNMKRVPFLKEFEVQDSLNGCGKRVMTISVKSVNIANKQTNSDTDDALSYDSISSNVADLCTSLWNTTLREMKYEILHDLVAHNSKQFMLEEYRSIAVTGLKYINTQQRNQLFGELKERVGSEFCFKFDKGLNITGKRENIAKITEDQPRFLKFCTSLGIVNNSGLYVKRTDHDRTIKAMLEITLEHFKEWIVEAEKRQQSKDASSKKLKGGKRSSQLLLKEHLDNYWKKEVNSSSSSSSSSSSTFSSSSTSFSYASIVARKSGMSKEEPERDTIETIVLDSEKRTKRTGRKKKDRSKTVSELKKSAQKASVQPSEQTMKLTEMIETCLETIANREKSLNEFIAQKQRENDEDRKTIQSLLNLLEQTKERSTINFEPTIKVEEEVKTPIRSNKRRRRQETPTFKAEKRENVHDPFKLSSNSTKKQGQGSYVRRSPALRKRQRNTSIRSKVEALKKGKPVKLLLRKKSEEKDETSTSSSSTVQGNKNSTVIVQNKDSTPIVENEEHKKPVHEETNIETGKEQEKEGQEISETSTARAVQGKEEEEEVEEKEEKEEEEVQIIGASEEGGSEPSTHFYSVNSHDSIVHGMRDPKRKPLGNRKGKNTSSSSSIPSVSALVSEKEDRDTAKNWDRLMEDPQTRDDVLDSMIEEGRKNIEAFGSPESVNDEKGKSGIDMLEDIVNDFNKSRSSQSLVHQEGFGDISNIDEDDDEPTTTLSHGSDDKTGSTDTGKQKEFVQTIRRSERIAAKRGIRKVNLNQSTGRDHIDPHGTETSSSSSSIHKNTSTSSSTSSSSSSQSQSVLGTNHGKSDSTSQDATDTVLSSVAGKQESL